MLVVSDLNELFIPVPDDLLVNLSESRTVVDNLLDSLPSMFESSNTVEACLGCALKSAYTIMKAIGGKMLLFNSSLPQTGDGKLKPRENPRIMGTPEEFKLLKPDTSWYKDTAVEFSRAQIAVDVFLFPHQFSDVATLCELAKQTGGTLNTYPSFNYENDSARFGSELNRILTRRTVFETVMRVRVTRGMRISNFYGNFFIRGTDLLALPNCTEESSFGFDIQHDEPMLCTSVITLQSALLYTSSEGQRRIRVHTHAIPVTSLMSEVVATVDVNTVCNLLSKQALDVALKTGLDTARSRLQQSCIDMIRSAKGGNRSSAYGGAYGQQQQQQQQSAEGAVKIPEVRRG